MAKTQVPSGYIEDDAITTAKIADNTIQAAHLHSSHGITTNNIGEHANNKYYTDARVDTRLAASKSSNFVTTGNIDVDSDTGKLRVGAGADLRISHDGSHSYIQNHTVGHLYIKNFADDKDIHFQSDDGSGGTTSYMYLDGSETSVRFAQNLRIDDGVKALFGASNDLQIYHSGTDSFIDESGTGKLFIRSNEIRLNKYTGEFMIRAIADGSVTLYHDNTARINTTSSGVSITGGANTTGTVTVTDTHPTLFLQTTGGGATDAAYLQKYNDHLYLYNKEASGALYLGTNNGTKLTINSAGDATFANNVIVTGNLTVNGSQTVLNTATLDVEDKNITLNKGSGDTSSTADGAGITIQDAVNSSTDASLTWNAAGDKFIFSHKLRMFGQLELPDNVKLIAGDSEDLQIFHDGSHSEIREQGQGDLRIRGDSIWVISSAGQNQISAASGVVKLYNAGTERLATTSTGVAVTGNLTVDKLLGTNSSGYLDFNFDTDNVYPQSTADNQTILGSVTHTNFVGDSNGNGTGGDFYWGYGITSAGGGTFTETMKLARSGDLTITGSAIVDDKLTIGDSTPNSNSFIEFGERLAANETNRAFIGQTNSGNSSSQDLGLGVHSSSGVIKFFAGNVSKFNESAVRATIASTYINFTEPLQMGGTEFISDTRNLSNIGTISSGAITSTNYITGTRLRAGDGTDGYFYSDTAGRTAFNGGDFYIQTGVTNYYNYATNQYHGYTSGDNHYFRGNNLSGNNWSIADSGIITNTIANNNVGLSISGTNSSYTSAAIKNTGSGDAILWLDASNGDLAGGDYASIRQNNALEIVIRTETSAAGISLQTQGAQRFRVSSGGTLERGSSNTATLTQAGALTVATGTFTGNVQHTGLTMTSGTDIDQLITATDSLTLSDAWQDTSIAGSDLASGTYIVQVYVNDNGVGGGHYQEFYSGVMSWTSSSTNSNEVDEIILHRAGHAPNTGDIYLRTERRYQSGDVGTLMLQIRGSTSNSGASNYIFKFRRMI